MDLPSQRPILLDGATGTNLMQAGAPKGACLEYWAMKHPQVVQELLQAYVAAGSQIVHAPTFGANRVRLAEHGFQDMMEEINVALVRTAKDAVGDRALVAGDIGPVAKPCAPFGELTFWDLIGIYAEQALALRDGGADLLICETMMSLEELRAAILGARQAKLPILASMTVGEDGQTAFGSDPLACMISVQDLGIAAFGLNCSYGPREMVPHLDRLAPYAKVPLLAKPNAGLPISTDPLQYGLSPQDFGREMVSLLEVGAGLLGGCCGTTPEYIAEMADAVKGFQAPKQSKAFSPEDLIAANDKQIFFLPEEVELSEPIPCSLDMADDLLRWEESGCGALCIQLDTFDDVELFGLNSHMIHDLPVCFSSHRAGLLENALIRYQGKALLDSRSEVDREVLLALCEHYGALLI